MDVLEGLSNYFEINLFNLLLYACVALMFASLGYLIGNLFILFTPNFICGSSKSLKISKILQGESYGGKTGWLAVLTISFLYKLHFIAIEDAHFIE